VPTLTLSLDLGYFELLDSPQQGSWIQSFPDDARDPTHGFSYEYYFDLSEKAKPSAGFRLPSTPLYESGAACGLDAETHVLDIPRQANGQPHVVRMALNNLCRFHHAMHLHGFQFAVLGTGWTAGANETPPV